MSDVLIVVATALEAKHLPRLDGARVVVSGIGPINAALATQAAILESRPRLALSVGIAGAYPGSGVQVGEVVVSSRMIFGGLGAMDGTRFLNLEDLGFVLLETDQTRVYNALEAASVAAHLARVTDAHFGPILTLETVTGSNRAALEIETRFPGALAEAMEGAGVALAAARHGVPALEVRGVSNLVGPRDRTSWRINEALEALEHALETGWDVLGEPSPGAARHRLPEGKG